MKLNQKNTNSNDTQKRNTPSTIKVKFGIKKKLLGLLVPIVLLAFATILFNVYKKTSDIILNKSETILETSTQSVVNKVEAWMNETITALNMERDTLEYFSLDQEKEMDYIKHTVGQYDSFPAGIYLATVDGQLWHASFVPGSDFNVFEKSWYKEGLVSDDFVFGSVYFDEDSQAFVVGASGILKDKNGITRGVAAADIYLTAISDIVKQVQLEKTGGMFLVDTNTNTIIGHKDNSLVGTPLANQKDEMYSYIGTLLEKNTTGMQEFHSKNGHIISLNLKRIADSNWLTVAYVPHNEVVEDLNTLTITIVIIALIGISLLVILMERFIHIIVKPVKKLNTAISSITDGDFSVNIDVKTHDEIGAMANGLHGFIFTMRELIQDMHTISSKLDLQAKNNTAIGTSLSQASNLQFNSISELNKTVEELTLSITDVAENATSLSLLVSDTCEKGTAASTFMQNAVAASSKGRDYMEQTVFSMQDIFVKINNLEQSSIQMGESITKINSIVDLIRDIAEETNLLSLNASIEAARAGEAGKGFCVVADEIGKLALTSANAVNNIAGLTRDIGSLVQKTVEETGQSVEAIKKSKYAVEETGSNFKIIFDAIKLTDTAVSEMVDNVTQVNDVATNVAGITEEQSASSQEILATSETLVANSEEVSLHSKEIDTGAHDLEENAVKLQEYLKNFTT